MFWKYVKKIHPKAKLNVKICPLKNFKPTNHSNMYTKDIF